MVLFEDYINLLIIEKNENVLQQKLKYWFQKNMINIGKTVAMSYQTKQSIFPMRPKITYRNMDIACESDTKFLGIHITENMKWTTHICILRLQLSKVCYIIKLVQGISGLDMIRCFYHSKF